MHATWAFEAGGRHSLAVRSDLAYGTTIWLDGRIVAVPWLPIAVAFLFPGLLAQVRVMHQEGGPIVLPIVLVGVAAAASAFFHAVQAHGRSAVRALVVTAALLGIVGYWTWAARAHLEELLEYSSPELAGELQTVFEHEAARPRQIGLTLAAAAGVLVMAGEVRRLTRRKTEAERE